ncbi:chaperone NapD [Shinella daejeonensis]|uniref:chaperone NapD n=1 Tax=Shinella daejeonensis TaxID=659017 RepID=UPI0020C7CF00|nr:chaperone NapD [Shinella daejeonensis]MCP8896072.1 chaperone NapD [Shinella daejeonensis]
MPDAERHHHISSAVVATKPGCLDGVLAALAGFANVEVYGADKGKIVIVIEGPTTGVLGDTLMRISVLEGVIAANMVFEHVEMEEEKVHGQRTDAA